jgi:hypothetical protein
MNFNLMAKQAINYLKINSPEILTGLAIVGVTAVLSHRAGVKRSERPPVEADSAVEQIKGEIDANWDVYIPAIVAGVSTVCFVVGSNRAGNKRTAAALAAYSFTEKAFTEYKRHVVDEIGEKKEKAIRDKAAEDRIAKTYDSSAPVVVGDGNVLCHEAYTDRYFMCEMETLRRAMNTVNHRAQTGGLTVCPLDDFYDEIGLPYTSNSGRVGWRAERLMALEFTSVLTGDGKPCLSFTYNYVDPL